MGWVITLVGGVFNAVVAEPGGVVDIEARSARTMDDHRIPQEERLAGRLRQALLRQMSEVTAGRS